MRRVNTGDLIPGMIAAEDVYTYANQLVLTRGIVLTDNTITKLSFYSILSVMVEDETVAMPSPVPLFPQEETFNQRVQASPEFRKFKKEFESEAGSLESTLNDVVKKNAPIDTNSLLSGILNLVSLQKEGSFPIFNMLNNMRMYDDVTYVHSINVGLICNVFARWLHMSDDEIKLATLCGLLHDIGKMLVPESIIKKPAKLTAHEYQQIKEHPVSGYKILHAHNIDPHICNAALMHHERCDGSGYPIGLPGDRIDRYAKIVAISDVYDATTSARLYRGPLCPFTVIALFENEGFAKYDPECIMTFLENIVNTYLLNTVYLSDGSTAKIVYINRAHLSQPTLETNDGKFIDLAKETKLKIEAII